MAAVTINNRFVTVLGPVKMEVANIASVDDNDTFASLLQNPLFAVFIDNEVDVNGGGQTGGVSISGKTLTFNNTNLSADDGVLLVFGF